MKRERLMLILAVGAALLVTNAATADLLTNGDFEMPSILGAGQTEVGKSNDRKSIETNPASPSWPYTISGVQHWDNALKLGSPPSASDQGLDSYEDITGDPPEPRHAFINNWNRRYNQTVSTLIKEGVTYTATVEFATRLDNPTQKRAGLFELRAGPMNPNDPDDPGNSILLDSLTAGQAGFYSGGVDPDVVVNDREWTGLELSYTPTGPGDPAIGQPLTFTFRTEWGSAGPTHWDNAILKAGTAPCPGDFNCDGKRDFDDIDPFVAALSSGQCTCPNFANCDPNGDGKITFDDIDPFIVVLGQPCP